jgi:ParB family chromosome partitioning protein
VPSKTRTLLGRRAAAVAAGVDRPTFITSADPDHRRDMLAEGARGEDRTRDMVYLGLRDIAPTPDQINSRTAYDDTSIEELAESIREYGVLQPVLVRPISSVDRTELRQGPRIVQFGSEWTPNYVLVAGNRRHMAAERAGREYIPAVIRVVERDQAFLLNIVENIQREELSGRERIRAIEMLASLRDERNQAYSTRELATLVKKDHATIQKWLGVHRVPSLADAVAEGSLRIGHAMILQTAIRHIPEEQLAEVVTPLIHESASLSQREVQDKVNDLKAHLKVQYRPTASQNQRRAAEALRKLNLIDLIESEDGPVRAGIEAVLTRCAELLGPARARLLLGAEPVRKPNSSRNPARPRKRA